MYYAIISDIVKSRNLDDRKAVQAALDKELKRINTKYESVIAAKFLITIGDEFQGLLRDGSRILDIMSEIQFALHPVKLRVGIGIGEISTGINPEMAIGADGPAYYMARESLMGIKQLSYSNKSAYSNIMIKVDSQRKDIEILNNLLNSILIAISSIESNWTEKQREAVKIMEFNARNQNEAAEMLKINQSSLQRRLSFSDYYKYKQHKEVFKETMIYLKGCENEL